MIKRIQTVTGYDIEITKAMLQGQRRRHHSWICCRQRPTSPVKRILLLYLLCNTHITQTYSTS